MRISVMWVAAAVAIALALFVLRMVRDPLALVAAVLRNAVVGCVGLLAIDFLGKSAGVHVPLNLASAGVAGVLGLPGVAALAVIHTWIL